MTNRLFVPLKTEHYRNFESGDKTIELRGKGNQFNFGTVQRGRPVELRRGYSTDDSLWGVIGACYWVHGLTNLLEHVDHTKIMPGSTQTEFLNSAEELLSDYDRYVAFEVDLFDLEREIEREFGTSTRLVVSAEYLKQTIGMPLEAVKAEIDGVSERQLSNDKYVIET